MAMLHRENAFFFLLPKQKSIYQEEEYEIENHYVTDDEKPDRNASKCAPIHGQISRLDHSNKETLGSEIPRSPTPPKFLQLTRQPSDSESSFTLSSGSCETSEYELALDPYIGISLDPVEQHALAVWTYRNPSTVHLLYIAREKNIQSLLTELVQDVDFDPIKENLCVIRANEMEFSKLSDAAVLERGSALLVLPQRAIYLDIEISPKNKRLPLVARTEMSVYELKQSVTRTTGFPPHQQDLSFDDETMDNNKRLCEYGMIDERAMRLKINMLHDRSVTVHAFWTSKPYVLLVDSCLTVSDVILRVMRKSFANPEGIDNFTSTVLLHMVLMCGYTTLEHATTLGFNEIYNNEDIHLTTVPQLHLIDMIEIRLIGHVCEKSLNDTVTVSRLDKWLTVALFVHGITSAWCDKISLKLEINCGKFYSVSLQDTITRDINVQIRMFTLHCSDIVKSPRMDGSCSVEIEIHKKVKETLYCNLNDKIEKIKKTLTLLGFPNAIDYKLITIYGDELTNSNIIQECLKSGNPSSEGNLSEKYNEKRKNSKQNKILLHTPRQRQSVNYTSSSHGDVKLLVKLDSFMIFAKKYDRDAVSVKVQLNDSLWTVYKKIQNKISCDKRTHVFYLCGEQLDIARDMRVANSNLSPHCTVHVHQKTDNHSFRIILTNNQHIELRVKKPVSYKSVREKLWTVTDIPDCAILSMETFLLWYFMLV